MDVCDADDMVRRTCFIEIKITVVLYLEESDFPWILISVTRIIRCCYSRRTCFIGIKITVVLYLEGSGFHDLDICVADYKML